MGYINVNPELCVGCGQCALVCEFDAIETAMGEARVLGDICIQCGSCIEFCPVGAIAIRER